MATVIDRVRAAVTGTDADRLAKRREIKQELAELRVAEEKHRALQRQIASLAAREAAAVAKHRTTCAPIQEKLQQAELEITELIVGDLEIPDRLAKQRGDAIEKIAAANVNLEAEAESCKKLRKQLELQRQNLQHAVSTIPAVRGKLAAHGICCPELALQRFVATSRIQWADKRRADAQREVNALEDRLGRKEGDSREHYNRDTPVDYEEQFDRRHPLVIALQELEEWRAELDAAEREFQAAMKDRDELRARILAE